MIKTLMRALIVGVFAVVAFQMAGTAATPTYAEVHTGNLHDCDDFSSQAAAQAHLVENPTDPDNLDSDNDDIACENFDYGGGDDYCDNNTVHSGCLVGDHVNCGGYICGNYCPSGNCNQCITFQCGQSCAGYLCNSYCA